MNLPSNSQVNAVLRHGGTAFGTVVTVFTAIGLLNPDDSAKLVAALHTLVDSLQQAVGAFYSIAAIVGPVIIGLAAKGAAASASLRSQLTAVTTNKQVQIPDGAIKAPAEIADAIPNNKVVPIQEQGK